MSRFLNQMRKTADFSIDARVSCGYMSDSDYLKGIVGQWREFLSEEALISTWSESELESYDGKEEFENDGETVMFFLKK
jgi:hypothetical protein